MLCGLICNELDFPSPQGEQYLSSASLVSLLYVKIVMMNEEVKPSGKPKRIKPKIVYSDYYSDHLAPRYWATWLGLFGMAICAYLPYRVTLLCGKIFGYLLYYFARSRRNITSTNIALCFPHLSKMGQAELVKETIIDNGVGLLELCIAWFNYQRIKPDMIELEGEQNLIDAIALGKGVILVGAHYTTLDLGGVLMAKYHKVGVMFRANKNPLFDLVMRNSRGEFCQEVIERGDMRSVIRFIRKGGVMWYAPDQDYGRKQSVFAPFFGIEASTINVIPRLVKLNQSPVLILSHHRKLDKSGYILSISEPLKDFPSGDDRADAMVINDGLEAQIRKYPQQYMWLHRRFKTRPDGEATLYQSNK